MFVARSIAADHNDLIHDVAYDFYGKRLATCSSDQTVKVWDLGEDGEWRCTANWKTHSGSVWKVTWAHPEFGQVLATCSYDRMATVWEELVAGKSSVLGGSSTSGGGNRNHPPMLAVGSDDPGPSTTGKVHVYEYCEGSRRWTRVETVVTVVDPVHDLAFAPSVGRSYYLLGIASRDVRIISFKPLLSEMMTSPMQDGVAAKFETKVVAQFDDHNSQAWRVSWNIIGTILASSGDDGCVRLWKANYMGIWKCIATLQGDGGVVQGDKQPAEMSSFPGQTGSSGGITTPHQNSAQAGSRRVPWH
ncbi:hypothetical protein MRX96_012268 [Rhipicephalus microplus]